MAAIRKALTGSVAYYEGDYESITSNKITPVKCVISSVSSEGAIAGGIGIVEDITDRREAEKELCRGKETVEALLNASTDTAFLTDTDGWILAANQTMALRFNLEIQDLVGKNCFDLIDPETAQFRREKFHEVIREKKAARFQDRRSDLYFDQHFYPVFDPNGELVKIAIFPRDITEQKKSEQVFLQSERFKAVASLAAGVAHNFNNLLQVVIAGSGLCLQEIKRGNVDNLPVILMRIINGCKFGVETVKRLQGFAGISTQKDHPVEILDVSEIITQAVEITKPFWKNAPEKEGIQIDLRLHLQEGCFIYGKKHELFEVLVNLIKNAVEAMPNGGNLDITCDLETKNVCIKVRDSGMGVDPENLGKLFTPFFTTKLASGSGLGLATTRKIIGDHNGHIFVTSESGRGALFTIILPKSEATKPTLKEGPVSR